MLGYHEKGLKFLFWDNRIKLNRANLNLVNSKTSVGLIISVTLGKTSLHYEVKYEISSMFFKANIFYV